MDAGIRQEVSCELSFFAFRERRSNSFYRNPEFKQKWDTTEMECKGTAAESWGSMIDVSVRATPCRKLMLTLLHPPADLATPRLGSPHGR